MAARYPWWKTLTVRKKRDQVLKDLENAENSENAADGSKQNVDSQDNRNSSLISDEMYDDSQEESAFNEHTSRRNLRVSRSGRFKEKRRIRVTLPEHNNLHDTTAAVAK
ncbi:proline-rich protein 15-like [Alosa pseudoharengus]|uniref:proline-rich protein 15-like n=1 Tax=Alosa pseudoharengus TaxID=34774 RepID=UPI003F88DB26